MTAFVLTYGLLVMLPGPNTALVTRAGLTLPAFERGSTVVGIALGAAMLVAVTSLPSAAMPIQSDYRTMATAAAGAVLLALGLRMLLRSTARQPGDLPTRGCGFRIAFLTAFCNPTSALYFTSSGISATALPSPVRVMLMAFSVFTIATAWFTFVCWMLSREPLRNRSSRYMREIDTGAALFLVAFGLFTILQAG